MMDDPSVPPAAHLRQRSSAKPESSTEDVHESVARHSARNLLAVEDNQEAVELPNVQSDRPRTSSSQNPAQAQSEHGTNLQQHNTRSTTGSRRFEGDGWYHRFRRFWTRHVSIKVPSQHRRDHLALERTFLAYIRTSVAISMVGIMTAQLLRLSSDSDGSVGGVPIAAAFISGSIVVVLAGAIRFWRQQIAMARGKVWAGGGELYFIMGTIIALSVGILVVLTVQPEPPT